MQPRALAAIIMAAGKGKRMNNPDLPKVMHNVGGMPLIEHVIRLADSCSAAPIVTIVGHGKEIVVQHLNQLNMNIETAVQEQQLGTGHAVQQAEKHLDNFHGDVMILSGDVPLTRKETLTSMLEKHWKTNAVVTVLTTELPDPSGYGRVIRNNEGNIVRIVEHKDASEAERKVKEINSGIYIFNKDHLFNALSNVTNSNAQGEYYLPDVFAMFDKQDLRMVPFVIDAIHEIQGVNTVEQLQELDDLYNRLQEIHP